MHCVRYDRYSRAVLGAVSENWGSISWDRVNLIRPPSWDRVNLMRPPNQMQRTWRGPAWFRV